MGDTRDCEQCGTVFVPRREHARFCSVPCRVAWNREHVGDPAAGVTALRWSITAMKDTAERLPGVSASDQPRAYAVIGEAVWWITIVDATLVRHHQEAYDGVMAGQAAAQRRVIDEILAGLRFVRNRIGDEADLAEFIEPGTPGSGAGGGPITDWAWKPVPEPALTSLAPRAQAWELTRYRAYQAQLACHTTGETFGQAVAFLALAAANATAALDAGAPAAPREERSAGPAART
ncbi:MAG TPA: hypothetical protein VLW44_14855 [Streptosporangiaceae bacterium]|nr:hypothetical protein [Streptosporangiaceae bacterium]